jgi:hypothetical protein
VAPLNAAEAAAVSTPAVKVWHVDGGVARITAAVEVVVNNSHNKLITTTAAAPKEDGEAAATAATAVAAVGDAFVHTSDGRLVRLGGGDAAASTAAKATRYDATSGFVVVSSPLSTTLRAFGGTSVASDLPSAANGDDVGGVDVSVLQSTPRGRAITCVYADATSGAVFTVHTEQRFSHIHEWRVDANAGGDGDGGNAASLKPWREFLVRGVVTCICTHVVPGNNSAEINGGGGGGGGSHLLCAGTSGGRIAIFDAASRLSMANASKLPSAPLVADFSVDSTTKKELKLAKKKAKVAAKVRERQQAAAAAGGGNGWVGGFDGDDAAAANIAAVDATATTIHGMVVCATGYDALQSGSGGDGGVNGGDNGGGGGGGGGMHALFCATSAGVVEVGLAARRVHRRLHHSLAADAGGGGGGDAAGGGFDALAFAANANNVSAVAASGGWLFSAAHEVRQWNAAAGACVRVFVLAPPAPVADPAAAAGEAAAIALASAPPTARLRLAVVSETASRTLRLFAACERAANVYEWGVNMHS